MIIFFYNNLLKKYHGTISYYASRIGNGSHEDDYQDMSIYLVEHIHKFDPTKSALSSYVNTVVNTAFRKVLFDKGKQEEFENSVSALPLEDLLPTFEREDGYDEFLHDIDALLKTDLRKTVFYAILYHKGQRRFSDIARILNVNYTVFQLNVRKIREAIHTVIENRNYYIK